MPAARILAMYQPVTLSLSLTFRIKTNKTGRSGTTQRAKRQFQIVVERWIRFPEAAIFIDATVSRQKVVDGLLVVIAYQKHRSNSPA